MIQFAALLARRVAGSPESLVRGLAVVAVLVVAAAALMAAPRPAQAAPPAGPACSVAGVAVAFLSDAPAQTAGRAVFDRTDLCAADLELPADLGLPRAPAEAPRARHAAAASYGYAPDAAPASAPDGSPHRPPRAA